MKKIFYITAILLFAGAFSSTAAVTAKSVLDSAASKLTGSNAMTAYFTVSQPGYDSTTSGHITVSGDRFAIISDEMSSWYDGKIQWTYSPAINEVNITSPTPDELRQVNPFAIINAFRTEFNYRLTSSSASAYTVELTPKKPSGEVSKAVITFDAKTWYPSVITITSTDHSTVIITVNDIKEVKSVPTSTFTFNKTKFPGVEIIDLR